MAELLHRAGRMTGAAYDVVIAGGGPAGLSAALMLGRCRRSVLLCDAGQPRNASSRALHGFLTRDGTPPLDLLRLGRDELVQYGTEIRQGTVTNLARTDGGFLVTLDHNRTVSASAVLIATGVEDDVPDVPGLRECYGQTVHHCPYCDGWEVRDKRLVVIGRGLPAAGLALSLKTWSRDITICSNGRLRIATQPRAQLAHQSIHVVETPLARLVHDDGRAKHLVLTTGEQIGCDAAFFTTTQTLRCELPRQLGCEVTRKGVIKTDRRGLTRVAGLYVVGDASYDVQFAIVAAAEGATAAVAINKVLQARTGLAVQPVA